MKNPSRVLQAFLSNLTASQKHANVAQLGERVQIAHVKAVSHDVKSQNLRRETDCDVIKSRATRRENESGKAVAKELATGQHAQVTQTASQLQNGNFVDFFAALKLSSE